MDQLVLFKAAPCAVSGCTSLARNRGWCGPHYQRWRLYGDPEGRKLRAGTPIDHADGTRTCNTCRSVKPIDQFPRDPAATLGRRGNCKPCHSSKVSEWYAANKDEHLPRQKARYERDIDKMRARDRARYERDKPKRIALATAAVHRRRALMAEVEFEPGITVKSLRKRHGDDCCYCGQAMTFMPADGRTYVPTKATIEHIIAITRGGGHTWANTTLACWQCNVRKNAKPLDEWLASTQVDDESVA